MSVYREKHHMSISSHLATGIYFWCKPGMLYLPAPPIPEGDTPTETKTINTNVSQSASIDKSQQYVVQLDIAFLTDDTQGQPVRKGFIVAQANYGKQNLRVSFHYKQVTSLVTTFCLN